MFLGRLVGSFSTYTDPNSPDAKARFLHNLNQQTLVVAHPQFLNSFQQYAFGKCLVPFLATNSSLKVSLLCFPPHGLSNLQPHHSLPLHCTMCSKLPCHARLPHGFPPNIGKASPRVPQGAVLSLHLSARYSTQRSSFEHPDQHCQCAPSWDFGETGNFHSVYITDGCSNHYRLHL
jgi:hypothetical protein